MCCLRDPQTIALSLDILLQVGKTALLRFALWMTGNVGAELICWLSDFYRFINFPFRSHLRLEFWSLGPLTGSWGDPQTLVAWVCARDVRRLFSSIPFHNSVTLIYIVHWFMFSFLLLFVQILFGYFSLWWTPYLSIPDLLLKTLFCVDMTTSRDISRITYILP